jgi:hypothetical protein
MSVRTAVRISSQRNGLSISPITVCGTCSPAKLAGINLSTRFICPRASWRTPISPFASTPAASQSSPRSCDQSFWTLDLVAIAVQPSKMRSLMSLMGRVSRAPFESDGA